MRLGKTKAFTLIELVMVIVIIGILAVVAIARYFDLAHDAETAAEMGVVAGVVSGIYTYYAQNKAFPPALDSASAGQACSFGNACFAAVLGQGGITQDWIKSGNFNYTGPTGRVYTYTAAEGFFK